MEDVGNAKENTPLESSSPSGVSLPNVQHVNGNMTIEARDSSELEHLKEDSRGISPKNRESSATLSESTPSSLLHMKTHTTSDRPAVEHDASPRLSSNSDTLKLPREKINESPVYTPSKDLEIKGDYPNSPRNANKTPTSIHSKHPENAEINQVLIDTAAPFKSVKQAVSKFGGIVDWKAHQAQTIERQKFIDQELEKVHEEIPLLKRQSEAAENAKQLVLKELDSTVRLVDQLKLNLERAQTEEQQARQDSELVKLRVEEMEHGIADESSIAAKAQLEVARARHVAALSELRTVTAEVEQLRKDYALLLYEKETALKKAEMAVSSSKEVEKTVEDLTIELITVKESLDAAHAALLEAEEHRIGATMAKEQDTLQWENDVKQAEGELASLNQQVIYAMDLQSKLDAANALLQDLKVELAAYMESKLEQEADIDLVEPGERTRSEIQSAIESTRKELEEVKLNLEKATAEVNCLKEAADSLKSELDVEKSELSTIRQIEGMASITVASLEAELDRTKADIALAQMKEKETREKMVEFPKQLQEAAKEADLAKTLAKTAREELRKAREEAQRAKAEASTIESRLHAAQKEIEAAKASQNLAFAAIDALQESESVRSTESPTVVVLSLEEYYLLSKQAHESEEQANMRVAAALSQIDLAKESELKSLKKLEEVNHEKAETKEALEHALQKAEKAKEGKLAVEQELREWRAEHGQRRKTSESRPVVNPSMSSRSSFEDRKESKASVLHHASSLNKHIEVSNPEKSFVLESNSGTDSSPEVKTKRKKKSLFPRILTFLSKKRSQGKTT